LSISNSESNGLYLNGCKLVGAQGHPARFPARLPEFFIRLLTSREDLVVDIFAGSNTTGQVAEREERRWLAFDERRDYIAASVFRFMIDQTNVETMRDVYQRVNSGVSVDLRAYIGQRQLAVPY